METRTLSLCTPVWGRYELTELMLRQRVITFERARRLGVECHCVVIGDDANLDTARGMGFDTIEAPNQLGRKYNDGHEWAVKNKFDVSFQVNSDQVFDPELLVAIARAPDDVLIQTRWLTAIHASGKRSLSTRNPLWSMTAYPLRLLAKRPRPCPEDWMRMCDTGVRQGVVAANPRAQPLDIEVGPLETIQFETGTQLTPWSRHVKVALLNGNPTERRPPWEAIGELHGEEFKRAMMAFYGVIR